MRDSARLLLLLSVGWGVTAWQRTAHAQTPAPPENKPVPQAEPTPEQELTAPVLKSPLEAVYPPDALRDRIEGSVGLELILDETGKVSSARVVTPAGHGFDEAALAAARDFVFEPARRSGVAVSSVLQFTYEFHLPPVAPAAAPPAAPAPTAAPSAPPEKEAVQNGTDQSTLVLATRPISAASSFSVRDRDFQLRPIGSVQDILRVTPGLVLVQHSGGGKANQYFIRGFDADHGTDLALSIDGIPINLVSHAHGQGFSDTNFIIPEVVEKVEITKGPYFANLGDFATAGSVNMVTRDSFEHSSIGVGFGGSPGHGAIGTRGLLVASPKFDSGIKATFAAEVGRNNGPFDNSENWDKYKLFNKLTYSPSPGSSISVAEMSYAGNWHGSGQIPARAVDNSITRFGSIDPDEGGNSSRHEVYVQYKLRPTEHSEIKALAYLGTYRFNLYSNFTLFLKDPENGDEIEQVDRRSMYGGRASYRTVSSIEGVRFDTTIGGEGRDDDIRAELWHTVERSRLNQMRGDNMNESSIGAFVNEEVTPVSWLRLNLGARDDLLSYSVQNTLPATVGGPGTGVGAVSQFSPKASVIWSPVQGDTNLDVYANYGNGFHSNDVRGAFSTPAVTPLTRAIGEEIGSRARLFKRWDLAIAFWQLDLASETVWNGDEGTTEAGGATTRKGIEAETRYEFTSWLAADADLTFTRSALKENAGNGNGLALAPKRTWSGGLSARHDLGPGTLRGGLRFYGISDRPASDDGALIAPGFTQVDLHIGWRQKWFDIAFDIENLLNGNYRSAQFDTTSRLRTEPAIGSPIPAGFTCGSKGRLARGPNGSAPTTFQGCEDVDFTPAYPLTARILATLYLD
jgi:TonB family protein